MLQPLLAAPTLCAASAAKPRVAGAGPVLMADGAAPQCGVPPHCCQMQPQIPLNADVYTASEAWQGMTSPQQSGWRIRGWWSGSRGSWPRCGFQRCEGAVLGAASFYLEMGELM